MNSALDRAVKHANAWLDGLDTRSVAATSDKAALRSKLNVPLADAGLEAAQVIDELVAMTEGGHLGSASGRFYGWVIGGALPSALAADWLTSAWDQNAALFACAPAAAVVEEVAGAWLKELFDLPRDASFAFTSGCQMSHFTCLAAARHAVLQKAGWDVGENGLFGAPAVRVLTGEHRHATVDRALRFLGFGARSIETLPCDRQARIETSGLEAALATTPAAPAIVVLNAADLNVGSFDKFQELIPLARTAGAWVHVDGAFGLFARASRSLRPLAEGIEAADSWATDGHKWLNVPYDCGIAIVRDQAAHRAAMTIGAAYISSHGDARDQIDWNPEWSRRARGFVVYAALRELGRRGLEELVDRCCAHCRTLVTALGQLPGAMALAEVGLNQGLVRFLDGRPNASEADHDARTDAVMARINASGEAFFSGTTWRGRRAVRVSVVNWRTSAADIERTIAAVRSALEGAGGGGGEVGDDQVGASAAD
ncbi:MAG TPA: pyridoxal-dependent decarboxylase, partial [Terriglobales bacterium]